jgi:hypothetical protein
MPQDFVGSNSFKPATTQWKEAASVETASFYLSDLIWLILLRRLSRGS